MTVGGAIVIACGSTGIAASQYPGGTTVHKCFHFGVDDFDETGIFQTTIGRGTRDALRLLSADLFIILDEALMVTIQLLDRIQATLRFLDPECQHAFAGANLLLVGDFLQLPPVQQDSPVYDRLLLTSDIWPDVRCFALSRPMRCPSADYHSFLTEVANGRVNRFQKWSDVPGICVTRNFQTAVEFLTQGVSRDAHFPLDRMWLAGTNKTVKEMNMLFHAMRSRGEATTAVAYRRRRQVRTKPQLHTRDGRSLPGIT